MPKGNIVNQKLAKLQTEFATAYTNYLRAIQALEPSRQLQPGVSGDWSVKDVVSHLIGWDEALCEFVRNPETFNPEPLYDVHTFNASSVAQRQAQSWTETVDELQTGFIMLQEGLAALPTEGRVVERVHDWLKGRKTDYEFHLAQLNDWLKQM